MAMPGTTLKKYLPSVSLMALLTLHAFLMNGHHHLYQYLPVGTYLDPIVAKADPSLFKKSLYVEAVHRTQVKLSIIDVVYPYLYHHFDFETCAILLELVSLFFILAGIFALSTVLFRNSTVGWVAMLLYTVEFNNWTLGSPSPYANFFHHSIPFAYPLILWSLVYFLRSRYTYALLLAGISWSFHPMCTVFLLFAYGTYWLFNRKEFTPKTLFAAIVVFSAPAFFTILKASSYLSHGTPSDQLWMTVVRWTAWYTCFPSLWPPLSIIRAGLFLALFIIALVYIPTNQVKNKILTFTFSVGIMCLLGTIFAEAYPIPFIIKLSLWRSTIIYLFLALSCIAYLLTAIANHGIAKRFLAVALAVLLTGYIKSFALYYLPLLITFLIVAFYEPYITKRFPHLRGKFSLLLFTSLAFLLTYQAIYDHGVLRLLTFFCFTLLFLLTGRYFNKIFHIKNSWVLPLVFVAMCDLGILYHKGGPAIYYHGRIQGKVDPWADIQMHARAISDKDDIFIIPPYLNNFGIYSMRATLGDWAEGGNALYLDQQFAHEWLSRMEDIGWRKLHGSVEGYTNLSTEEVHHASKKYGVKFVITEKPKTFELKKIYENDRFILYQIS